MPNLSPESAYALFTEKHPDATLKDAFEVAWQMATVRSPEASADETDATFRRNFGLLIRNMREDDKGEITWMSIVCRGVEQSLYPLAQASKVYERVPYGYFSKNGGTACAEVDPKWKGESDVFPLYARATAPQASDHYQQLLSVAYVVLGCLVANGVDIPVRFLDAFADPDSVENPLELLPCDFSPAQAVRAAVEAVTDDQILDEYAKHVHTTYAGGVNVLSAMEPGGFVKAVRALLAQGASQWER